MKTLNFLKGGSFGAITTLIGMIIGAGVLGLPYVIAQAGFITGIITMIVVTVIMVLSSLYVGEIIQRTKGKTNLLGIAEEYFGKKGKIILTIIIFTGMFGTLIAYTIGAGDILNTITGIGNPKLWAGIFWVIIATIIYFGLRFMENTEKILSPTKLIIMLVIGFALISKINPSNLTVFDATKLHLPFSVILFSLFGIYALVTMNEELKDPRKFKKTIIWGIIISAICYLIFTISLVGVMGKNTTEVATIGLSSLGNTPMILINLFGLLSLLTAGIAIGFALKEMLMYDYKIPRKESWLWVAIIPFLFNLIRPGSFIDMLGLTATVGGGLLVVMMLIIHSKAIKKGKYMPSFTMPNNWWIKGSLIAIFVAAAIYEIIYVFF